MSGTLRDQLLPLLDQVRGIPGALGIRRYQLAVRTRTWAGLKPGLPVGSVPLVSDLQVKPAAADAVGFKVRNLSQNEVNGSNGQYQTGDVVVTGITPSYGAGGYSMAMLKPVPDTNQEVQYILTSVDDGTQFECDLAGDTFEKPFRYQLVLRRIAPPVRG